jgi:formylmethanofuran dehydrogenase subunit E
MTTMELEVDTMTTDDTTTTGATPEHCERCGIPLAKQMPEDATTDEMLCDRCYGEGA